jgi:metal-responsive CopG/Arc/MetJ family transcriptional regulator
VETRPSRVSVTIPPDVLSRIDADAARVGIGRNEWIRRACERALLPVHRVGFGQSQVRGSIMVKQLLCAHEHVSEFAGYGRLCDDCQRPVD